MRITPSKITTLKGNEIFVFGSNLAGRHGAGAARTAKQWGARYGQAKGLQGRTYGIPTKDERVQHALPLEEIYHYVGEFVEFARLRPNLTFLVTEIGCGLSGYDPAQIAPLFEDAVGVNNIHLPERFWQVLNQINYE